MIISNEIDKAVVNALRLGQSEYNVARRFNIRVSAVRQIAVQELYRSEVRSISPTGRHTETKPEIQNVRSILRASNQNGQYDKALHPNPAERETDQPKMQSMDFASLELLAMGSMPIEMLGATRRTPEQKELDFFKMMAGSTMHQRGKPEEAKPAKPKLSPMQYLEISKQIATALAAKKALEKTKEQADAINPLTYVQHLEDEDLMYLLQVGMNELQKRYYGKDQTSSSSPIQNG